MTQLHSLLLLLVTAVPAVVLCRRFKLPAMLGYLFVGLLIGPYSLGLISTDREAGHLGEFGVVFLMFTLGLEFNLAKLKAMRRTVFGLGSSQVIVTLLFVMFITMIGGFSWQTGFALGCAAAMSSTAMVSKLLSDRNEIHALHGQNAIGILLFQDLAVVPFLIMLPVLGNSGKGMLISLGFATIKIVVVLLVLLYIGQKLMRPWFNLIARQHSSELFMLNLFLVTLGIAWLTEQAGLSLALGAFLAGMLISETQYRYQVEEDIRPFRDLLLGLFFVTIGMKLDFSSLIEEWILMLLILLILVPIKITLIASLVRAFGGTAGAGWRTGLTLGQGGEFAFVLIGLADHANLIPTVLTQAALAGVVLSMLVTPFLIQHSDKIVLRLASSEWMNRATKLHHIAVRTMQEQEHVILCGYGRSGQSLTRLLLKEKISFFALDLDPERVREAVAAGESVVFGDAAKREVLIAVGLMRAKALVVTYSDTQSSLRILETVRQIRPDLPVIIRTQDDSDIDRLKEAGATEVVAEVLEGSLMLASHTLMLLGTPLNRVLKCIRDIREARYSLLRGFFRGLADDLEDLDYPQPRLHTVHLVPGSAAIGKKISELDLDELHVEVRSIRRNMLQIMTDDDPHLQTGDVLVLYGETEGLAAAEMLALQGTF